MITTLGAFGPAPDGLNNIYVSSQQETDSPAVYLHDRFTSFSDATIAIPPSGGGTGFTHGDVKGHRLGLTPDYTLSASLTFRLPTTIVPELRGEVSVNVTWSHNDGFLPNQRIGCSNRPITWSMLRSP